MDGASHGRIWSFGEQMAQLYYTTTYIANSGGIMKKMSVSIENPASP